VKLKNKPIAFIDLETTGLLSGHHEIIEACIIKEGFFYHVYAQPNHIDRAHPKALSINGYSPKKWIDGITQKSLAGSLGDILDGCIIIGHNPKFDIEFIELLFEEYNIPLGIDRRSIDTMTIAYMYLVPLGLDSISLDSIRSFMGWEVRPTHNALDDTKDVERLYRLFSSKKRYLWLIMFYIKRFFGVIK
jgi:DNA polymerase III alpha subunit (gram-positive type)